MIPRTFRGTYAAALDPRPRRIMNKRGLRASRSGCALRLRAHNLLQPPSILKILDSPPCTLILLIKQKLTNLGF